MFFYYVFIVYGFLGNRLSRFRRLLCFNYSIVDNWFLLGVGGYENINYGLVDWGRYCLIVIKGKLSVYFRM